MNFYEFWKIEKIFFTPKNRKKVKCKSNLYLWANKTGPTFKWFIFHILTKNILSNFPIEHGQTSDKSFFNLSNGEHLSEKKIRLKKCVSFILFFRFFFFTFFWVYTKKEKWKKKKTEKSLVKLGNICSIKFLKL